MWRQTRMRRALVPILSLAFTPILMSYLLGSVRAHPNSLYVAVVLGSRVVRSRTISDPVVAGGIAEGIDHEPVVWPWARTICPASASRLQAILLTFRYPGHRPEAVRYDACDQFVIDGGLPRTAGRRLVRQIESIVRDSAGRQRENVCTKVRGHHCTFERFPPATDRPD